MKIVFGMTALLFVLAGCGGGSDYDARPVEGKTECFQIQDANDNYKALGTYCKVDLK